MEMRDRYYRTLNGTGALVGNGNSFTNMFVSGVESTVKQSTTDPTMMNFTVTLTSGWNIPSFLADPYTVNGVQLTPVLEVLCTRLYYPSLGSAYSTGFPISVYDTETTYQHTDMASFSGVEAGDPAIRRVIAGGIALFGDAAAQGNYGSIYAQMDLPIPPGALLPSASRFEFTVPTTVTDGNYAFTPLDGDDLECYLGASYTNPGAPPTSIAMRDRYYAFLTRGESLKGDGARYTDMLPVNATYELVNDQFVHFDIKLEDSWLLPSFLDDMQMDNSTVLSPAIEILCVDLYYPHASMSAATALPMRAVGENSVYFSTSLATFGGVQPVSTSYGVNVKRVLAGGFANTGDLDSDGTHGSMYAQMDLPVRPGKTLPSGTRFEFSAPSVFISNEFADAFTSIDSTLKCYFGATYTNPSAAVEHLTMRDRYYKSLNNTGTLAGNGVSFTDMSSDTYSSTSMLSSKIRFSVTLNNPWVVPAFLADSFIKDDVALTPVVELLCVRLRYPHVKMDIAQDLTFRASYTGATFFTSYTGTFSGLELKPREVLKPLWFEHVTESSEPYYVGRWGVTVHDYSFDIDAGAYIDMLIPDSHAYEFKLETGAAQPYAPTEAYYPPTQCTVNGVAASELMLPTYTPYADPMAATVAYDMAVKGPVDKALISPLATPSPGNGTTYDLGLRVRMRVPTIIRKADHINTDFKTMDINVMCTSARNPNETMSDGQLKFVMYDQQYKDDIEAMGESPFSGFTGNAIFPLVPVASVRLATIIDMPWGNAATSSFAAANNTAGSDYSTVTLTVQPHNLPISTRGVIDFRLPSSWLVQPIPVGHPRAGIICVASVDIGSSVDADIDGVTVMDAVKRRISFYPKKYIRASPNGVFRLFCEGVRVPTSAKTAITITPRVYETIVPFSWTPAPGQKQDDYVFPTRSLYLENADVSLPRITNTLAPRSALTHTLQFETLNIFSQEQLDLIQDAYMTVLNTAIRIGRLKPNAQPLQTSAAEADSSTAVMADNTVAAYTSILYRLRVYRNSLNYRKVWTDDYGNYEYDITSKVTVLLEGLSGTNAYQLRDLLLANNEILVVHVGEQLKSFVLSSREPTVLEIPGSCTANTYANDGNLSDSGCGRGCANCAVGYSCFDDTDCLSGLCGTGVAGNATFVPVMDTEGSPGRQGFRNKCIETISDETEENSAPAHFSAVYIMFIMCLPVLAIFA
jgi:hypothetical protein